MLFHNQLLAFLLCIFSSSRLIAGADNHEVLVDQLTSDYLKVEQSLWRVIEKREPSTLQQIYNIHTRFMSLSYGETNVLREQIYLNLNQSVSQNVVAIDEVTAKLSLEFFENRNYVALSAIAEKGIHLEHETEAIFQSTVNDTSFWEVIQNVSGLVLGRAAIFASLNNLDFLVLADAQMSWNNGNTRVGIPSAVRALSGYSGDIVEGVYFISIVVHDFAFT